MNVSLVLGISWVHSKFSSWVSQKLSPVPRKSVIAVYQSQRSLTRTGREGDGKTLKKHNFQCINVHNFPRKEVLSWRKAVVESFGGNKLLFYSCPYGFSLRVLFLPTAADRFRISSSADLKKHKKLSWSAPCYISSMPNTRYSRKRLFAPLHAEKMVMSYGNWNYEKTK